ncbi:alpha/beta hydrolase family protein [Microtetraspora malaysiensis]|uniref:alpha/beta hydrolase family protein n=1 Tax=Microtetraspora malaysiensis TaxID=161358 RepID=UPI00083759A0|nr:alpha/beta fold hydrolase [Microtetraspora malaysiensis]
MEADHEAAARAVVELARDERFGDLEALFAPPLRAQVSAEAVRTAWASETGRTGPVSAVGTPVSEPIHSGLVRVSVPVTCERGGLTMVMALDETGLIHGLRLAPPGTAAWTPPPYADQETFDEHEVTLGAGPLAVPGTLSLPRGHEPRPGVVLLAGGGPFDRDATSGPNKPLKDLAWGLASRGVAVLRFDKVTHVHGAQVADTPGFTMSEEYVPHAVAAVRLLQAQPRVDPGRVFVVGHSMGGKVAPRVAAAEPSVAGLVILAGDAQPMHRAAVRVTRYLASLDPGAEEFAELIARQAATVDSPGLSPSTPAAELPFGLPGAYWLDLRGYDPVAAAAALDRPMLILQGGRDYQVTVEDDLARWRAGLAHRADVTIRVHDADNHLFFPGAGPSTPAEYEAAHHVDAAVVADVAEWLAPRGRPGGGGGPGCP